MPTTENRTERLMSELHEALSHRDGGRALYLLVRELAGDPMTEEVAICNPDSGKTIGFLVPAERRYALHTPTELQSIQKTLSERRDKGRTR